MKYGLVDMVLHCGEYDSSKYRGIPFFRDHLFLAVPRKYISAPFQQALTMMVPSLSFRPNAMGSYLMMNGLSNKHVLILVNGRKVTGDITGNIDLNQIDMTRVKRIEVLNGAASSLYGSDAIGGVINIITNEPKDVVAFSSNSSYTRKNQFSQA